MQRDARPAPEGRRGIVRRMVRKHQGRRGDPRASSRDCANEAGRARRGAGAGQTGGTRHACDGRRRESLRRTHPLARERLCSMIKYVRDLRLIPVVLVASAGLFALKMTGIIADGGYTLGAGHLAKTDRIARESAKIVTTQLLRPPALGEDRVADAAPAKQSWAQEMFGYPDVTGSVGGSKPKEETGSAGDEKKADDKKADAKAAQSRPTRNLRRTGRRSSS